MHQRLFSIVAFVLIVACGHHDAPAPAATGSAPAATPTATTPTAATPAAAPSADDRACKLITQDEAAKVLGHAVKPGEPRATGPVTGCHFKADGVPGSVSVQFYDHGDQSIEQVRTMMIKDPVTIANAGTKAYRNADGSLLLVLANGHMGVVISTSLGKDSGPTAAAADAFAPVLATRL